VTFSKKLAVVSENLIPDWIPELLVFSCEDLAPQFVCNTVYLHANFAAAYHPVVMDGH